MLDCNGGIENEQSSSACPAPAEDAAQSRVCRGSYEPKCWGLMPSRNDRAPMVMPELTRRPHPERSDCWHVFCGDVQVGTIAVQSGLPVKAKQWRWDVGFYPASHRGGSRSGYAATFKQARAGFETAWKNYLPRCTEADFVEYRRQRAWTAWKYGMHAVGLPLLMQSTGGQERCFCGAPIDLAATDQLACLDRRHEAYQ
jgi:hypothetical protein